MKKIPTLFVREYKNHKVVGITPDYTNDECLRAMLDGTPTVKVDGACCAIINGIFCKRFDAKKGRKIPEGAIPCCDPDPVTGHHPHWVAATNSPDDKWFWSALNHSGITPAFDGLTITYEAIGPHFQGNPYNLEYDILIEHGEHQVEVTRSFEGIRDYLEKTPIEGIVFWLNDEPVCKIKRSDFGFQWPCEGARF